ncbi:Extracellular matrix-binding ebh, putative [Babesia ovata]|uniref:Extracellular matrix-binding ebh, putative n=1 Tax=Babesia ovata TaxID=189622 RepID=A0A2H6K9S1_9APIC|nr:Extracellular matrix-binding ebh, putative [Babesia ovata]GBE59728.1 Extracellular matrix-binding ebh, putative [Babesia ovata]
MCIVVSEAVAGRSSQASQRFCCSGQKLTAVIPGLAVEYDEYNVAVICHNIGAINTANKTFLHHVIKLGTWITDAEKIRQAADDKAKEAYDKLKVNETLDENVKKIVKAKVEIEKVHKSLGNHLSSLGAWNQQARTVLDGAIKQATEVWNGLNDSDTSKGIGGEIHKMTQAKDAINVANSDLKTEVDNLGKWRAAAQNVISKAEQKCNTILEKVSTTDPQGPIFKDAEILKEKGTELYNAASKAKIEVESKVRDALQAVVAMDKSLKTDLKSVKDEMKKGIERVIKTLGVLNLDGLVKEDLRMLRGNILGLTNGDDKVSSLVGPQLQELGRKKEPLDTLAVKDGEGSIKKGITEMDRLFSEKIQQPLKSLTDDVANNINELYKKIDPTQPNAQNKNLQEIFEHIKGKVGEIKGKEGRKNSSWYLEGGSGILGIEGAIKNYANAFGVNETFNARVRGWLDGIWGKEKGVKNTKTLEWLANYVTSKVTNWDSGSLSVNAGGPEQADVFRDAIIGAVNKHFNPAETEAEGKVIAVRGQKDGHGEIQKSIAAVKAGCKHLVQQMDVEFKKNGIDSVAEEIYNIVPNKDTNGNNNKKEQIKLFIIHSLIALRATVNQVSEELESVLLSDYRMDKANKRSIAGELDSVLGYTNKLHEQLTQATQKSVPPGGQPVPGTAQAVDSKLQAVSGQVKTLYTEFETKVTKELKDTVKELPTAVETFNQQAQAQIRAAARTAIGSAVKEFKTKSGAGNEIDVERNMTESHPAYDNIKRSLKKILIKELTRTLGWM